MFFFFKPKTAYEMRISDWSSDVCSSDLEIFGINTHIRAVCDGYAADGYYCVAPGLFDRVERGVYLGYTGDDVARGRDLRGKMTWDACMKDEIGRASCRERVCQYV